MREYEQISDWYAENRGLNAGLSEALGLVSGLPAGARVLDLGCGTGIPIARALLERGFDVYGIDSSPRMIERYRVNCPRAHARCATIQASDYFDMQFEAVVAWGVFFHLEEGEQALAIARVAEHLVDGGRFLFSSAKEEGVAEGTMDDVAFRYVSLGTERYGRMLRRHGLEPTKEYLDAMDNYVYCARKEPLDSRGF